MTEILKKMDNLLSRAEQSRAEQSRAEQSRAEQNYTCRGFFLLYTALFACMFLIVYHSFFANGKSLMWTGDGLRQHFISLNYYAQWGREALSNIFLEHNFELPLWDFSIGYGSDILTTFHYYVIGDPLNLFCFFVPSEYMEYFYSALVVLRLYLAGLSFSCYCFYMHPKWRPGKGRIFTGSRLSARFSCGAAGVLIGSMIYVFGGDMLLVVMRHPFFANPFIYMPLLLIGVEKILRKEKPTLFIGMVFLSAVSNFYFFYMIVLGTALYVAVRFFSVSHERIIRDAVSTVLRLLGYGAIGVLMAGIIFFPVVVHFTESGRSGAQLLFSMLYKPSYYKKFFTLFMDGKGLGMSTYLGFPAAAVLGIFFLFTKKKSNTGLKVVFLILTAMLMLPFFGKMFNGFAYVTNRWCFMYAGFVAYVTVVVWNEFVQSSMARLFLVSALCVLYYILLVLFRKYSTEMTWISCSILFASLFISLVSGFFQKKPYIREVCSACFFVVTLFHIALIGNYGFSLSGRQRVLTCTDVGTAWETVQNTAPMAAKLAMDLEAERTAQENRFCRFEMDDFIIVNSASLIGVNGLQYYWSLENAKISQYLMDMAVGKFLQYNYRDLDHRTFLGALASVKYDVFSNTSVYPFGFQDEGEIAVGSKKRYRIFRNQYELPLGYTYDSYISADMFQEMDAPRRQEALLGGVLLDEKGEREAAGRIGKADPVYTGNSRAYAVKCKKGVIQEADHTFLVEKKNAVVEITFEGLSDCETYFLVHGADFTLNNKDLEEVYLNVDLEGAQNRLRYTTPVFRNYTGQKDYLINLGFHTDEKKQITITFPEPGRYNFEKMEVICQPMENYVSKMGDLRKETLNEKVGTNFIKGDISVSTDKILCLTIPYSRGWNAYVDGKKVSLFQTNGMFMGLLLEKGEHVVELHYHTPGLFTGFIASLLGFLLFAVLLCLIRWRKMNEKSILP